MTKEQITDLVITTTADTIGIDPTEIKMDSDFRNDLGCDSLLLAELIMIFEDKFKLTIPDAEAENFSSIRHVVDYIGSLEEH